MTINTKQEHSRAGWKSTVFFLKRFFASYVWLGFTMILISIIADQTAAPPRSIGMRITIDLLATIGIAILVAAIFSFAAGTTDFLNRITELLQNVVINRKFLNNMDDDAKKDVLRAILR